MTAACPHADRAAGQRVCRHLLSGEADSYAHRFTGVGIDYDLVCPACGERGAEPAELGSDLCAACDDCFEAVVARATWVRGPRAVIDRPAIAERSTQLSFAHQMVRLSHGLGASLLDLQPHRGHTESRWLAVTSAGKLVALDLDGRRWGPVADLGGALDLDRDVELEVSPDGTMAAIAESDGQSGVVIDIATGELTMVFDRGGEAVEGSRFPFAFARPGGRLVLVQSTEWNRLAAFDPRTGERLTPDSGGAGLDYVCSGLTASPDGEWLLDNGFTAQGAGVPTIFRLRPWLEGRAGEPEQGESLRYLCQRWDLWDAPACWIDGATLAISGYGPDRDSLMAAVLLFDAPSGAPVRWFPGPRGPLVHDDGLLFSLGDGDGVSVWDVETGERLLHDAGFHPLRYHAGSRQFLTTNPDGELFVLSRLVGDRG